MVIELMKIEREFFLAKKTSEELKNYLLNKEELIKNDSIEILFLCLKYNYIFNDLYIYLEKNLTNKDKYDLLYFCLNKKKEQESLLILNSGIDVDLYFINLISVINNLGNEMEAISELVLLKMNKSLTKEQFNLLSVDLKNKLNFIRNIKEF